MTTSAPQVIRHSLRTLDSLVLIFFWQWVTSSRGSFSLILNFQRASSNIVVISFNLGSSLQNEQLLLGIYAKHLSCNYWHCCKPTWNSVNHVCDMITPNIKGKSLHTVWHATHDQKLHSFFDSWFEGEMGWKWCKVIEQIFPIDGCSGKCICFTFSRFSMLSFGVSHLPIVSTIIVHQLNT